MVATLEELVQGEGMRGAHMLVWLGDFNYRIDGGYEAVKERAIRNELGPLLELVSPLLAIGCLLQTASFTCCAMSSIAPGCCQTTLPFCLPACSCTAAGPVPAGDDGGAGVPGAARGGPHLPPHLQV